MFTLRWPELTIWRRSAGPERKCYEASADQSQSLSKVDANVCAERSCPWRAPNKGIRIASNHSHLRVCSTCLKAQKNLLAPERQACWTTRSGGFGNEKHRVCRSFLQVSKNLSWHAVGDNRSLARDPRPDHMPCNQSGLTRESAAQTAGWAASASSGSSSKSSIARRSASGRGRPRSAPWTVATVSLAAASSRNGQDETSS